MGVKNAQPEVGKVGQIWQRVSDGFDKFRTNAASL